MPSNGTVADKVVAVSGLGRGMGRAVKRKQARKARESALLARVELDQW